MEFSTEPFEIKIFIGVKRILRLLGYLKFDNHPNKNAMNIFQNIFCVFALNVFTCASIWFFLFQPETFAERTENVFVIDYMFSVFIAYCIMIVQRNEILDLISQLELQIRKRKIIKKNKIV